jgi:hypothetical protein
MKRQPSSPRLLAAALATALATAAVLAASPTRPGKPVPETRRVFVGASPCEEKEGHKYSSRTLTLSCVARGAHLIFYDAEREAIHEIRFASEEQRVEVLNEFAGTEVNARGFWEDREGRVRLVGVWKVSSEEPQVRTRKP